MWKQATIVVGEGEISRSKKCIQKSDPNWMQDAKIEIRKIKSAF